MTPQLHPRPGALRHTPIAGVILTNGEVDAVAGLLSMREGSPFTLYAHARVLAILKSNSIFNVLGDTNVRRESIDHPTAIGEQREEIFRKSLRTGCKFDPDAPPGGNFGACAEVLAAWSPSHPAGSQGRRQRVNVRRGSLSKTRCLRSNARFRFCFDELSMQSPFCMFL